MQKNCNICGHALTQPFGGAWHLTRCRNCRHLLNLASLEKQKAKTSRFFDDPNYIRFRAGSRNYFEGLAESRLADLLKSQNNVRSKTLLDVGCSNGEFLHKASAYFGGVTGQDLSQRAVEYCKDHYGLTAYTDMSALRGKEFDFVCCFHVIEHVAIPRDFINSLVPLVKNGGTLYLRTPNANSWLSRLGGPNWPGVSNEHINLFSPASIKLTLECAGFERVNVFSRSHSRFLLGTMRRILSGGSRPNGRAGSGASRKSGKSALSLMMLANKFYFPVGKLEEFFNVGDELVTTGTKNLSTIESGNRARQCQ